MVKIIDTSIVSRSEVIYKTKEQIIKEAELPRYFLKLPKYFAELEITKSKGREIYYTRFNSYSRRRVWREERKSKESISQKIGNIKKWKELIGLY